MCRIPLIEDYLEPPSLIELYVDGEEEYHTEVQQQQQQQQQEQQVQQENQQTQDPEQEQQQIPGFVMVENLENYFSPLQVEVYSDIEEVMNRVSDYETGTTNDINNTILVDDNCDLCGHTYRYNDLRMCYRCLNFFCDSCALPVSVSILQCCNYHCLVIWFCSAPCREGLTRATVRAVHNVQTPCV